MNYSVRYKKGLIWKTVKGVVGDTILRDDSPGKGTDAPMPVRVIFFADKTRLEIPMTCLIEFSKERFYIIQKGMEKESGQKMATD